MIKTQGFKFGTVLLALALASCDVSLPPAVQLQHLRAQPTMQRALKTQLNHEDLFAVGDWPNAQWWQLFAAPELDALIKAALACNPSILEVKSRVDAARQESIIARSALYPLVYFNGRDINLHSSKNGLYRALNPDFPLNAYLLDLSLSFNYEFDFWAQNHNLFQAALGKTRAEQATAAQVILITTTALAQVYFAYKTNLLRRDLYQQQVEVRHGISQLSNLLAKHALSSALNPWLAAEGENEAKKLLAGIDEELAVQMHLLNILAGRDPDTPLTITKELPRVPKRLLIPKTISLDLIARRPDLMAQIWRAKIWAHRTGAAVADFYPNVNLMGLVGLESTKWNKLFDINSVMGYAKPTFHLPIFTAGAIRANVNANYAEFNAAIQAYNNLLLQSTKEVLDILAFARSIYTQKEEQNKIVTLAKKRYALTRLRKQKGLDSQFDDYRFHDLLIQKQLNDVVLLYNQYVAVIKLIKALGGGYCQEPVPLRRME